MRAGRRAGYDGRYRVKLNMLGPGTLMLKAAALMLAVGALLWQLGLSAPAAALLSLAGATLALTLILVLIELHQDRVLNDIAREENRAREKNGEIF